AQDFDLTRYRYHSAWRCCHRNERLHRLRRRQDSAQGISNRAATEENGRTAFIWVVSETFWSCPPRIFFARNHDWKLLTKLTNDYACCSHGALSPCCTTRTPRQSGAAT